MPNRNRSLLKKIYFPGLISLVFLPVLIVGSFLYHQYFDKMTVLQIDWVTNKSIGCYFGNCDSVFDISKFRKFKSAALTGDLTNDESVFTYLQKKVNDLRLFNDTTLAYSVAFSQKTKYEDMVRVIDISKNSGNKNIRTIVYGNRVLVWATRRNAEKKYPIIHPIDIDSDFGVPDDPVTSFEVFLRKITGPSKRLIAFWPSGIAFILLVWFGIRKKNKPYL